MFALHGLSKSNHLVVLQGFASVPQHQKCHLSKSSSFPQCPVVITHTSQWPSAYHRLQVLKEIYITANCRMCLQFSGGQEIKNIHFLNHTGQGQHWHLVPECRAGFAMLAYTWVRRASLPSQDWKDPCSPQAVQGWMCQMSLPGAGYLCYQEMHPAPNRNNRDGSGFKALAQTLK